MKQRTWRFPLAALFLAFCAGVVFEWVLLRHGPPKPAEEEIRAEVPQKPQVRLKPDATTSSVGTAGDVRDSRLRVPIDGADPTTWKGAFYERRNGDRPHEAVDILAPRNTPVHAVADGAIAKLFLSKNGGNTIYQFDDNDDRRCYYYAHLERYAEGLHDGQHVSQGDVIGYVGTSGNAPPDTPHLHFAIFELDADRHWWRGRAIDPYELFANDSALREHADR